MKKESTHKQGTIHIPPGTRVAIVAAMFTVDITQALVDGACRALAEQGMAQEDIALFRVPGSVELPLAAAACAQSGTYNAIICLGAVIRGETDHYQYVCRMAADGIREVNQTYGIPTLFGVLTCHTEEQARERTKPDTSNTGYQVARGALEMINTLNAIKHS